MAAYTIESVVELTKALIAKPSLTPEDAGCQELTGRILADAGFSLETVSKDGTVNLLALHGSGAPFTLFLGHTDVVPPGPAEHWTYPPFAGTVAAQDGEELLYGRGSADMKGSDAAMTLALAAFVQAHPEHQGTVGLLLTSNEEGDGRGGVKDVAALLKERALIPDYCLVGEPSAAQTLGDTVKIGRRGSLTAHITVIGKQGHVAYPERLINPVHQAAALIARLAAPLDQGNDSFPPTSFEVTNIKAGTGAENVVPESCYFMCNWRYNNLQSPESIEHFINAAIAELKLNCRVQLKVNGLPFLSAQGALLEAVLTAIAESRPEIKPQLSTSGGTSDGRFIAPLGTQVLEFGPCASTIHQIDERVQVKDLKLLPKLYLRVLELLQL